MLLNRKLAREVRNQVESLLIEKSPTYSNTLADFEVDVARSTTYSDTEVTFKITMRMKGAKSQAEKDLEDWAEMDNLDLTKIVKLQGKSFSLSWYRRKAPKKPYLVQDLDGGGEYIMTREMVKRLFGKKDKTISLSDKPIGGR